MSKFYSAEEMKMLLDEKSQYRDMLYRRGFLITNNSENINNDEYPFYGCWKQTSLDEQREYRLLTHNLTDSYVRQKNDKSIFLIGHAYNPFTMEYEENKILDNLIESLGNGTDAFWKKVSELTGIFCIGYIQDGKLAFSTDCTGMQTIYYGQKNESIYVASHSKLIADLCGFNRDDYITRLVNHKFYRYFGVWLPGDLSPFKEIKRTQPNYEVSYTKENRKILLKRYYPLEKVEKISEAQYCTTIEEMAEILSNSMKLIAKKWPNKKAALSMTGGRDSTTTLACAKGVYDQISYYSYISNYDEEVDAKAAAKIAAHLGLRHKIYQVPEDGDLYNDIEIYKMILECNAGCIGSNNLNDVKKRIYFNQVNDFDVEIKSWVNEICRGGWHNKYNKKSFPKKPTPSYCRCMWKVILNYRLIKESDMIFKDYLEKYYSEDVFEKLDWWDLLYWEFSWSGAEGIFMTSEHKFSYDITIPFNNRILVNKMLTVPLEKQFGDNIPKDIIRLKNIEVEQANIVVKDISHTDFRALITRTYLNVFSKIK